MAVKIRLMRMGAKKAPFSRVEIDTEKASAWLAKGAQPTEAVAKLLSIAGVEGLAERKQAAKTLRATQAKAKAEPRPAKGKKK
jgi:small subunit ribosomal protein S16